MNYHNTVIVGDFNTDWRKICNKTTRLKSVTDSYGLTCINTEPTHFHSNGSSQIDLFFTSNVQFMNNVHQVSSPVFSNHDIVFSSIEISRSRCADTRAYRDYNNVNMQCLLSAINLVDWSQFDSIDDPDIAVDLFNSIISDLHETFVPIRYSKPRKNPWFNRDISNAIIDRNLAYKL